MSESIYTNIAFNSEYHNMAIGNATGHMHYIPWNPELLEQ